MHIYLQVVNDIFFGYHVGVNMLLKKHYFMRVQKI